VSRKRVRRKLKHAFVVMRGRWRDMGIASKIPRLGQTIMLKRAGCSVGSFRVTACKTVHVPNPATCATVEFPGMELAKLPRNKRGMKVALTLA